MQERNKRHESSIIMESNPQSSISEAYRTLRTNVDFTLPEEERKVIMVTSSQQEEGKTTTAINLAVAYAQNDKKVLLVDADLRKPGAHQMFNKPNRIGLSNLLAGQYSNQELIVETNIPNLELITSGPIPPNPSELLSSTRWTDFIEFAKSNYNIIIIDTPPALHIPDAMLVSGQCSGVILVVDTGKVKREVVKKMKGNLEHARAKILGVVLNNMNRKEAGTYA